jgi:hypothetical protein
VSKNGIHVSNSSVISCALYTYDIAQLWYSYHKINHLIHLSFLHKKRRCGHVSKTLYCIGIIKPTRQVANSAKMLHAIFDKPYKSYSKMHSF